MGATNCINHTGLSGPNQKRRHGQVQSPLLRHGPCAVSISINLRDGSYTLGKHVRVYVCTENLRCPVAGPRLPASVLLTSKNGSSRGGRHISEKWLRIWVLRHRLYFTQYSYAVGGQEGYSPLSERVRENDEIRNLQLEEVTYDMAPPSPGEPRVLTSSMRRYQKIKSLIRSN